MTRTPNTPSKRVNQTKKLTKQVIDAAIRDLSLGQLRSELDIGEAEDPKAVIIWDSEQRGFGVRIGLSNERYANGKVTFFIQKRLPGATNSIRYVFAEYPEIDVATARDKALRLIAEIRNGSNIARERKDTLHKYKSILAKQRAEDEAKKPKKFKLIFENYRKTRSDGSVYWEKGFNYYNNKYFLPRFKDADIHEITKADIRSLLRAITHQSVAKKAEQLLGPFFKYCVQEDIITANPMADLAPIEAVPDRDRVLSQAELVAFWRACEDMKKSGSLFGHIFQLLLLTGQRLREIAHMERSELDEKEGLFTIQAKRAKNGKSHIVHMSTLALEIINSAPRRGNQLVFSSKRGGKIEGFGLTKRRLDRRMERILGKTMDAWQLRDIRRSMVTVCAEKLKIDPKILDRILNHVPGDRRGVAGVYQRAELLDERKEAIYKWNDWVKATIINA